MHTLLPYSGIITVLNTPFTREDTIDVPGLTTNVRAAITAGVAGFLVPAMASEVGKLSPAERRLIVRTVLDETRGRVPVIGGISAPDGSQRAAAARELVDLGCAGVLVSIPYAGEVSYRAAVEEVLRVDPPFLMLQDWAPDGLGIPVEVIARLFADFSAFRAIKIEVVPAGAKYSQVLAATGGRLHVSGGWAVMQMIEALDRDVHAFMPTGMHAIYVRIFNLYRQGQRAAAQALFEQVLPVLAFANQHLDISIHFFKHLLHQQGRFATPLVRPPSLPFDEIHLLHARALAARALKLESQITSGKWDESLSKTIFPSLGRKSKKEKK